MLTQDQIYVFKLKWLTQIALATMNDNSYDLVSFTANYTILSCEITSRYDTWTIVWLSLSKPHYLHRLQHTWDTGQLTLNAKIVSTRTLPRITDLISFSGFPG